MCAGKKDTNQTQTGQGTALLVRFPRGEQTREERQSSREPETREGEGFAIQRDKLAFGTSHKQKLFSYPGGGLSWEVSRNEKDRESFVATNRKDETNDELAKKPREKGAGRRRKGDTQKFEPRSKP